jgi:hypothetical protein
MENGIGSPHVCFAQECAAVPPERGDNEHENSEIYVCFGCAAGGGIAEQTGRVDTRERCSHVMICFLTEKREPGHV